MHLLLRCLEPASIMLHVPVPVLSSVRCPGLGKCMRPRCYVAAQGALMRWLTRMHLEMDFRTEPAAQQQTAQSTAWDQHSSSSSMLRPQPRKAARASAASATLSASTQGSAGPSPMQPIAKLDNDVVLTSGHSLPHTRPVSLRSLPR